MSRLIDADALDDVLDEIEGLRAHAAFTEGIMVARRELALAPTIDAEPVRHGRWEDIKGAIRCSECQEKPLYDYHGRLVLTRWCHACGVKMWKEIKSENH